MRQVPSSALTDPTMRMPDVPASSDGVAWLRCNVVRFRDGATHAGLRSLTETIIVSVCDAEFVDDATSTLLRALDLPDDLAPVVAVVAAAYQPHAPQSAAADAAADRLVRACGGRTELAAAKACVLVQAHAATAALAANLRSGSSAPPASTTRRVTAEGEAVEVDLTDAHFGRGEHRCPGEPLARRLAAEIAGRGK